MSWFREEMIEKAVDALMANRNAKSDIMREVYREDIAITLQVLLGTCATCECQLLEEEQEDPACGSCVCSGLHHERMYGALDCTCTDCEVCKCRKMVCGECGKCARCDGHAEGCKGCPAKNV